MNDKMVKAELVKIAKKLTAGNIDIIKDIQSVNDREIHCCIIAVLKDDMELELIDIIDLEDHALKVRKKSIDDLRREYVADGRLSDNWFWISNKNKLSYSAFFSFTGFNDKNIIVEELKAMGFTQR